MSRKRKNRNNKKVLQALRQKRAKGGRSGLAHGGKPNRDQFQSTDAYEQALAAWEAGHSSTTTTTTTDNTPSPPTPEEIKDKRIDKTAKRTEAIATGNKKVLSKVAPQPKVDTTKATVKAGTITRDKDVETIKKSPTAKQGVVGTKGTKVLRQQLVKK